MTLVERIPESYLAEICKRAFLSDVIGRDIPLKRAGREFKALCPFHNERTPSFFVNDQKGFWHCFGCGAHGNAIDWIVKYRGLPFKSAVETLAGEKPPSDAQRWESSLRAKAEEHSARPCWDNVLHDAQISNQAHARAIWRHCIPIAGTMAETYLRNRGITIKRWAPSLRFTEKAWTFSYERGLRRGNYPALVAGIQDSLGRVTAVQLTYLLDDGSWHIGRKFRRKAKLVIGPMQDGAIRLSRPGDTLGIAEGIESAYSCQQMYGIPTWAATGQSRRQSIIIPQCVKEVIIFAENSDKVDDVTTEKAKLSYIDQDKKVYIQYPQEQFSDPNDELMGVVRAPQMIGVA